MNRIEMSEKIRDHLIKQKARSVSESGSCKYRNADGLMCAVGCLLTDDVYDVYGTDIEGKISNDSEVHTALEKSGLVIDEHMEHVARSWQRYHDNSCEDMSYQTWVAFDSEQHSPEAFFNFITKEQDK